MRKGRLSVGNNRWDNEGLGNIQVVIPLKIMKETLISRKIGRYAGVIIAMVG